MKISKKSKRKYTFLKLMKMETQNSEMYEIKQITMLHPVAEKLHQKTYYFTSNNYKNKDE